MKILRKTLFSCSWLALFFLSPPSFSSEDMEDQNLEPLSSASPPVEGTLPEREPVADITWGAGSIEFLPKLGGELTLKIIGPDFAYFDHGEGNLYFNAVKMDGSPLVDGIYHYELRQREVQSTYVQSALKGKYSRTEMEVKRQLKREDKLTAPRALTQDSVFYIKAGVVIAPGT